MCLIQKKRLDLTGAWTDGWQLQLCSVTTVNDLYRDASGVSRGCGRSGISAKLRYTRTPPTDMLYVTTKGHHQRTSSQQFYNLLYSKFTSNSQKFATSQHLDMSRCWALALRCGKFVVQQVAELLSSSVGGVVQHVRSRCPCSGFGLTRLMRSPGSTIS